MTTIDVTVFTTHCQTGTHCRHNICAGECGNPLRAWNHTPEDHPGTRQHAGHGMCHKCARNTPKLSDEDLQDQRHVLLSDDEMIRVRETSPEMYVWHLQRRHRLVLTILDRRPL